MVINEIVNELSKNEFLKKSCRSSRIYFENGQNTFT